MEPAVRSVHRVERRRRAPHLLAAAALVLAGLLPAAARANCAAPTGYAAAVTGNTVTVELKNFTGRACPDPGGLLRQDADGGQVVTLAQYCSDAGAYLDECVPPGTYRYGLASPYACQPSSCSTSYYQAVTVTAPLGSCSRGAGDPGPTAGGTAPWGVSDVVCISGGDAGPGSGGGGGGAAGGGSGGGGGGSAPAGTGCGALPRGAGAVLWTDGLVLAAGALGLALRRRARR